MLKASVKTRINPPMAEALSKNTIKEIADERLLVRIQNGDSRAFAILVDRHTQRFYATAMRTVGQPHMAEDIVQEAFLKLWQKPQSFDPSKGAKFTTWFTRVVTNLAIDVLRKQKPQAAPEVLDMIEDQGISADEALDQNTRAQALERAIQALPDRQKIALNLCFYEGLSNKEAAEILGIGVKALESLLMRAKKTLKNELSSGL